MNKLLPFLCLLCALPSVVTAADISPQPTMPIVYALGEITIQRNTQHGTAQPDGQAVTALPPSLKLDVELRAADSFYKQDGWFTLTSIQSRKGLLLLFEEPQQAPIIQASQYAPVDIVMINKEGTITSIVPSLVLAKLEETIIPAEPIKAFLMLAGGSCEELFIQPGDEVLHGAFKKPHPILTKPQAAPPTPLLQDEARIETPAQKVPATITKLKTQKEIAEKKAKEAAAPFDLEKLFTPARTAPVRRKPKRQQAPPSKKP